MMVCETCGQSLLDMTAEQVRIHILRHVRDYKGRGPR